MPVGILDLRVIHTRKCASRHTDLRVTHTRKCGASALERVYCRCDFSRTIFVRAAPNSATWPTHLFD